MKLSIRLVFSLLLLSLLTLLIVAAKRPENRERALLSNRAKWDARGSRSYTMTVEFFYLPLPPIGVMLSIQDGKAVREALISCENPSAEYPHLWCESARLNYHPAGYTMDSIFQIADRCTDQTKASLAKCTVLDKATYQGFTTPESMVDAVGKCGDVLQSSDILCSVEYEPYYGYPTTISTIVPGVLDGFGTIKVKNIHIGR